MISITQLFELDLPSGKFKPYTIKTDEEAKEHAIRFAKDMS
jgi:hypothetical protein